MYWLKWSKRIICLSISISNVEFVPSFTWKNSMNSTINLEKRQTQIDSSWTKYSSFGTHQIYSS